MASKDPLDNGIPYIYAPARPREIPHPGQVVNYKKITISL